MNWDSFKWRNHQPDIGRFFNIDPLAEDYYYNSLYAFSENKVVAHREIEGLEAEYAADLGAYVSQHPDGAVAAASGFLVGVGNAVGNSIEGVFNTVMHPIQTLEGLATSSTIGGQMGAAMQQATVLADKVNTLENGSILEKSIVVGEIAGTAAELAFGTKGASTFLKGAETGKAINTLSKTVDIAEGGIKRIQNAANRIKKPITVVGSRASGTATAASDFDYVIPALKNADWKKIKNSLPGAAISAENLPRRIDVFKGAIDPKKPHITVTPKRN